MSDRLQDTTTLITGASTETGPYIARRFAQAGSDLVLTYYSNEEALEEVAEECEDMGAGVKTVYLDILDQDSIDDLIGRLARKIDTLDVVVLCAGSVGLRNFRELSRDELDTAIDGNLKGNFMLAKELGYRMKDNEESLGRVIQYTAQSAANTSHSAYGLAKAGQRESTEFLAYHLAPEVTVNTIQPISIDQDPTHDTAESYDAPLDRKVHSRELADMARTMCQPVFDTVTGEVIRMDSGRHTQPAYPKDL